MFGRNNTRRAAESGAQYSNAIAISEKSGSLPTGSEVAALMARKAGVSPSPDENGFVLVGKGTTIAGEISNCSVVEIQGTLEGSLSANAVIIREGGAFRGDIRVEQAEVHGTVDGRMTVHGLLDVRASGCVTGEVTYETLCVAAGGHLSGELRSPAAIEVGSTQPAGYETGTSAPINGHAYDHASHGQAAS